MSRSEMILQTSVACCKHMLDKRREGHAVIADSRGWRTRRARVQVSERTDSLMPRRHATRRCCATPATAAQSDA